MTIPIDGVIRRYDWGSRVAIQQLLGERPDGRPAAELWFGAHPGDPSPAQGSTLDKVLAARGEPELPYLLKVLAAEKALSIQVHPNRAQAQAGFEREQAEGIARDAPERNYVDRNHKPELLCALTPFDALCGFRPIAQTLALLDQLAIPELCFLIDLLRGPDGLRAAFTALLTHREPERLVAAVIERARPDGPLRAAYLAAEHFPNDVGVVVALLLNHVRLRPGEAIYLGAGNVHCYLRGTGVEILANSDNVLRCGLTSKHVDVAELLRIASFAELAEPRWPARDATFAVPVPDFQLRQLRPDDASIELVEAGSRIVLSVAGTMSVADVELRPGHAAFVPAGTAATLTGTGHAFEAAVAQPDDRPR
jgi:mannose-6-phosphate isomerase